MKYEISPTGEMVLIDCMICGRMFPVPNFLSFSPKTVQAIKEAYEKYRSCPVCEEDLLAKEKAAKKQDAAEKDFPVMLEKSGIEFYYSHDRTTGELFKEPPCRYLAEFIYRNRNKNLLISGLTGCGKSTSASFIAMGFLHDGKKVQYASLRKLLASWREAKTSKDESATEKFLYALFRNDLFIIDEVVGKARISESGQELLFEILESVNSGACRARIWLLGNFYGGSIEEIFSDAAPVRRRLQENFTCVYADRAQQTVTPITVWKEDQ